MTAPYCQRLFLHAVLFIYSRQNRISEIEVIDGANATGIIDDSTGLLVEGYAVLERDKNKNPKTEAYFTKGDTWIYRKGDETPERIKNNDHTRFLSRSYSGRMR